MPLSHAVNAADWAASATRGCELLAACSRATSVTLAVATSKLTSTEASAGAASSQRRRRRPAAATESTAERTCTASASTCSCAAVTVSNVVVKGANEAAERPSKVTAAPTGATATAGWPPRPPKPAPRPAVSASTAHTAAHCARRRRQAGCGTGVARPSPHRSPAWCMVKARDSPACASKQETRCVSARPQRGQRGARDSSAAAVTAFSAHGSTGGAPRVKSAIMAARRWYCALLRRAADASATAQAPRQHVALPPLFDHAQAHQDAAMQPTSAAPPPAARPRNAARSARKVPTRGRHHHTRTIQSLLVVNSSKKARS